jgi:hypothetical protein
MQSIQYDIINKDENNWVNLKENTINEEGINV